jgi:SAM-dependent methyltransferase
MSSEHWDRFLQTGAIASCPTSADGTYDLELAEGWRTFFASLPAHSTVLDVGTGNGPILLIAKAESDRAGLSLRLHGSDRAAIDPPRYVPDGAQRYAGIMFHPGASTEALPFDTGLIDAVTGQFALEYGDPVRSIGEVARVLRPAASARFVVHHAQSIVVETARRSLRHADWIRGELQVFERLERFLHMERVKSAATDRAFAKLEEAGRAMTEELRRVSHSHVLDVTLSAVQNLLDVRSRASPQSVSAEIEAKRRSLRSATARMQDLLAHACSAQRIAELESIASKAGLAVTPRTEQHHDGNLVGWVLNWRKPDQFPTGT